MGAGWLGWSCNVICIIWTLFICVLFSLPTYFPVTAVNMNYTSIITVGVIAFSLYVLPSTSFSTLITISSENRVWYFSGWVVIVNTGALPFG